MKVEERARARIDHQLEECGWRVQDRDEMNIYAQRGVAVRELSMPGAGEADYLLYADGKAISVVEAKPEDWTLKGVELQSGGYMAGLAKEVPAFRRPLPFGYETTGTVTQFTNSLEPEARSREVFAFHRPEELVRLARLETQVREGLRELPPLIEEGLWPAQVEAITNLERSLAENRPRSLIQMATGSGKTFTAVSAVSRLVKFAGANRVLFLVDRKNLGTQTLTEFQQYVSPYNDYSFAEEYNVQHLRSNRVDGAGRVVITTVQRLYSMLKGEEEFDEEREEGSGGFNRSVQHGRVVGVVRTGGMGLANLGRPGLSAVRRKDLWDRWKAGESISDIARALKKPPGSIHGVLKATGGIAPPQRRRPRWALTLAEREEISRGLASGDSMRAIAVRLGRSASTVSREVGRNGGRSNYRALKADERAWDRARRPKRCLLAESPRLRDVVAKKLKEDWSPQQISGWLVRRYPDDGVMRVSHETIYRTLFVQTKGALKKELLAHLRSGRTMRKARRASTSGQQRGQIKDAVSIRKRPAEAEDRAVPGHWEGDLLAGARNTHIVTGITTVWWTLFHFRLRSPPRRWLARSQPG